MTRATDADTVAELVAGTAIYVTGATSTAFGTQWVLTSAPVTMALGPVVFTAGDPGIVLTGDVTTSGTVATIAAAAVTLAKMASLATLRLIGRVTAGTGVPEAIAIVADMATFIQAADKAAMRTALGVGAGDTITAAGFAGPLTGDVTGNVTGNLTGNAATVTTNADLTGDVTSSGNATTLTIATILAKFAAGVNALVMNAQSITGVNVIAAATATLTGKLTTYNSLTTVEGGIPSCVKSDSKTAQTANLGATTIYASAPAKRYRISVCATITTFGTTATIPRGNVIFTHGGVVKTIMVAQSLASFSTANGTIGSGLIDVDASTNIQYSTGGTGGDYASTGTAMQYDLYVVLEAV